MQAVIVPVHTPTGQIHWNPAYLSPPRPIHRPSCLQIIFFALWAYFFKPLSYLQHLQNLPLATNPSIILAIPQDSCPGENVHTLYHMALRFDDSITTTLPQVTHNDNNLSFVWEQYVTFSAALLLPNSFELAIHPVLNISTISHYLHLLLMNQVTLCKYWWHLLALCIPTNMTIPQDGVRLLTYVRALHILPGTYHSDPSDLDLETIILLSFPKFTTHTVPAPHSFSPMTQSRIQDIAQCIAWAYKFTFNSGIALLLPHGMTTHNSLNDSLHPTCLPNWSPNLTNPSSHNSPSPSNQLSCIHIWPTSNQICSNPLMRSLLQHYQQLSTHSQPFLIFYHVFHTWAEQEKVLHFSFHHSTMAPAIPIDINHHNYLDSISCKAFHYNGFHHPDPNPIIIPFAPKFHLNK